MSVIIRGMKMPTEREWVDVRIFRDGTAIVTEERARRTNHQAIELPPHGRLIDADALIKGHFSDEHRIAMSYADKCWMRRIINGEPTIIPASKEEKEETE